MREASWLLWQICSINPFTHAVELIRFALHVQLDPTSLMATLGWTTLFLGLAILGYDPQKGFVASTGKGE
jgi:ABC-2 type transport system permease protein